MKRQLTWLQFHPVSKHASSRFMLFAFFPIPYTAIVFWPILYIKRGRWLMSFWLQFMIFALNFFYNRMAANENKFHVDFLFNKLRSIFCSLLKPVLQSTRFLCLCLTFSFYCHCVSHSNFFFVCFDLCIQNLFIHYYVRNVHRLYKSLKNIGIHRKTKRMNHKKEWAASYVMNFVMRTSM